jgi:hypothetical protein
LLRYRVLPGLLIIIMGCSSHTADGDDVSGEEINTGPAYYDTPDGVNYSISEWRYTNAIRPGGELELYLQCYNKSDEPVDGPAVLGG